MIQEPEPLLGKGERQVYRMRDRLKGDHLPACRGLGERPEALG